MWLRDLADIITVNEISESEIAAAVLAQQACHNISLGLVVTEYQLWQYGKKHKPSAPDLAESSNDSGFYTIQSGTYNALIGDLIDTNDIHWCLLVFLQHAVSILPRLLSSVMCLSKEPNGRTPESDKAFCCSSFQNSSVWASRLQGYKIKV